ncbi:MAG TPA: FAD-dependent oxidoreductase, partial [Acidimicrobiales bacterium]|nr:FAD-dependent oxidoreductase [Acidimicrobiales bacterium]
VVGARVSADGVDFEVRARWVVNAAGVWADDVRALDEGAHPNSIRPAKGIHVTLPWSAVRNDIAVILPVPRDRRSVFVVPWGDQTYVGTTDTDYDGRLDDPQCTPDDVSYLLGALNAAMSEPVSEADVVGTWAGLRPLLRGAGDARTADLSRRHRVGADAAGLVTVTGGKLTTYRRMAADTVDVVVHRLGRGHRRSPTRNLALIGAEGTSGLRAPGAASRLGTDPAVLEHLVRRYGGEARAVLAMAGRDPALSRPLVPGLPYLAAEAVYAARYEMATTVEDVLSRRTRALLLARDAAADAAPEVARLLAAELGWDQHEAEAQAGAFQALVTAERDAAGLVPSAPVMAGAPTASAGPVGPAAPV